MIDYNKMAEANNLGWQVETVPLVTQDGQDTEFYAVRRQDTRDIFTTVKERYVPFQNHELFELADAVANEANLPVHKAGFFGTGGKVFVQLKGNTLKGIGKNNDTIENYVTCINSHDGTSSIRWGHSNLTISCQNTFHAVKSKLKSSARHTTKMHDKIKDSVRQIQLVREAQSLLDDKLYQMAEFEVDQNIIDNFLSQITGVDIRLPEDELRSKNHGRLINKAMDIKNSVYKEISYKGANLWGLFNGVTHYTTHVYGRDKTRDEAKMFGGSNAIDQNALALTSQILDSTWSSTALNDLKR
jgi:phage/plasmid-like protein (TIGR03299 family)